MCRTTLWKLLLSGWLFFKNSLSSLAYLIVNLSDGSLRRGRYSRIIFRGINLPSLCVNLSVKVCCSSHDGLYLLVTQLRHVQLLPWSECFDCRYCFVALIFCLVPWISFLHDQCVVSPLRKLLKFMCLFISSVSSSQDFPKLIMKVFLQGLVQQNIQHPL